MRMEALDAVQEGRAIVRRGERTYPNGTVLWIEPPSKKGLGVYDGGPGDGATVKIKAGRCQYIVHCTRIAGTDNYVTTGEQPICYTHVQIGPMLVHTRAMYTRHEKSTGQMRKAAVNQRGGRSLWSERRQSEISSGEILRQKASWRVAEVPYD